MNKAEYLHHIRKQIHYIFDRNEIEKELEQHIQDSIDDLMEDGLSKEEAEKQAVAQMGDPIEVGKQLNQEHHPLLGYLYIASKSVLYLLIIPAIIMIGYFGYNMIQLATPTVIDNSIDTISLNIDLDISTHYVKIDNICQDEAGNYYLTYRSWIDYGYSRAGWSSELFYLENSNGEYLIGSGYQSAGFIGSCGYKSFTWPKDNLLYLISRDGKRIEIDLKEYSHEKK